MPDPKPAVLYAHLKEPRERFLDYAEETARLVFPTLRVRGENTRNDVQPWTGEGISGARSLASSVMKIIMPPGVMWGAVDLPAELWPWLEGQAAAGAADPQAVQGLKQKLRIRTNTIMQGLTQKSTRARLSFGVRRNLVEGSTAVRNLPRGLTIFPLRSHVVKRNEYGEVELLILEEILTPDPYTAEKPEDLDKTSSVFTMINYDRQEIWRTTDDGETIVTERIEDEDPMFYFVFVSEIPDVDDYPTGYAYNYLRLLAQLDHEESSLAEAMSFASWNPIGVREGSTLATDPAAVTSRKTSEPMVMQDGDIIWPNKAHVLGDWGFLAQMRAADKAEAAKIFAKGIKDLPMSPDRSATEVLQIVDEINSETADLLSAYEETLQRPLLLSESRMQDKLQPLFEGLDRAVFGRMLRIVISTGVNAIDKQRVLSNFVMNYLPKVIEMDPRVQANGVPLLDRISEGMLVNTEGLYQERQMQEQAQNQLMALSAGMEARRGAGGAGGPEPGTRIMTRGGPQRVGGYPQPEK